MTKDLEEIKKIVEKNFSITKNLEQTLELLDDFEETGVDIRFFVPHIKEEMFYLCVSINDIIEIITIKKNDRDLYYKVESFNKNDINSVDFCSRNEYSYVSVKHNGTSNSFTLKELEDANIIKNFFQHLLGNRNHNMV